MRPITTVTHNPGYHCIENSVWQTTIAKVVSCQGTGVHSGKTVKLTFRPAPENHGIVFQRTDITDRNARIAASWRYVSETQWCTTLTNEEGVSLSTVEHVLSALAGIGVDNVLIEVTGPEMPIMDGSSAHFVDMIDEAGILTQEASRKVLRILKEVQIEHNGRWAKLTPATQQEFTFHCLFDRPVALEDQHLSLVLSSSRYRTEVAKARTFGFVEDVEALKARGFARGASLDNAVGLTAQGVMNPDGLRYDDECVRHKILDAIGDLCLAGSPILGAFEGYCSGHQLNYFLVKALMQDPSATECVPMTALSPSLQA